MASRKDDKGRVLLKGESQRKSDGMYMFRWTERNGKRACIYEPDLNTLRKREENITRKLSDGLVNNRCTLNDQIEKYLAIKPSLAISTRENYEYYFHHDIEDSFLGKMQVTDIRKSDILMFYKSCADKDYKNGTIHILHKIIHPTLELAVDDYIIARNPAKGCMRDYPEDSEVKYALTIDQEKEFEERLHIMTRMVTFIPFYMIMLRLGLRLSEMIGLTWLDVDMRNRTISVNHQLQYRNVKGKTTLFCTKHTKTKSGMRTIPMSEEVHQLFQEQRKLTLQMNRDMSFKIDGYSNFVFLSYRTGRPFYHSNIRRQLRKLVDMNSCREIQLPPITPHILRHTACTRYAEAGIDLKAIQYLMGHTDIKTTLKVYNHVDMERAKRAIQTYEDWRMKNTG